MYVHNTLETEEDSTGGKFSTVTRQKTQLKLGFCHKVDRVLGFFSSRPNWESPTPSPAGECGPPLWFGGGGTLACERGDGGSQFRRGDGHCGTLCTLWVMLRFSPWAPIVQIMKKLDRTKFFTRLNGWPPDMKVSNILTKTIQSSIL
jgi:hypothetical protein